MKVVKMTTNGFITIEDVNYENDDFKFLKSLQELVGGSIETVCPRHLYEIEGIERSTIMLVDEEGICKRKPINILASELYGSHSIVGDAVFLKLYIDSDGETDITGLTDEEAKAIQGALLKHFINKKEDK